MAKETDTETTEAPARCAAPAGYPGGENLMLCINGVERFVPVPSGFWEMERQGLKAFIALMWPGVTWASNGQCGMWAINLYLEKDNNKNQAP
jgi:hypothetical protein